MRRAERLFRLVNEMRTRDVVRAEDLAKTLEVSLSTIYRDIAHLQGSGLPIEGEAGVGYLLRPGFEMPNTTFTHDQLDALAVGLAFVESTGDPILAAAAREVRAKIQAGLPDPAERKLADAPYFSVPGERGAPQEAGQVRTAIRGRRVVELAYRNAAGTASERQVQPLIMWNLSNGWMFSGWCRLRKDFRTFRFDRAAWVRVTDEVFEITPQTDVDAFMSAEDCSAQDLNANIESGVIQTFRAS